MRERPRAELGVCVGLEVLVGEPAVLAELLFVRQIDAVADLEPGLRLDVDAHAPLLGETERAPANERRHRPRKVVVQARHRDIGRGVGVVDREHLSLRERSTRTS